MKYFYGITAIAVLVYGISLTPPCNYHVFIDWWALGFVVFPVFCSLLSRYGKKIFSYRSLQPSMKKMIAQDGGFFSLVWGFIATLMTLMTMLLNLSNPDDIGPGFRLAFISLLYGFILYLIISLPVQWGNNREQSQEEQ